MTVNMEILHRQIDALERKNLSELQAQFEELYGFVPGDTNAKNLRQRIAYRLQEITLGGLSEADKVLLVGLKDMVPDTGDVTKPVKMTLPAHYSRMTLKALPFAPFDTNAKVTLRLDGGKATLKINELTIDASKVTVKNGAQTMLEVGT